MQSQWPIGGLVTRRNEALLLRRHFRKFDVALMQRDGIFASIELNSDGGRAVPAQDDTTLVLKPRAALPSKMGKTYPHAVSNFCVVADHWSAPLN